MNIQIATEGMRQHMQLQFEWASVLENVLEYNPKQSSNLPNLLALMDFKRYDLFRIAPDSSF